MIDFSRVQKIRTEQDVENERVSNEAIKYLLETDWYVIRSLETKKAIPKEILDLREDARRKVIKQ